MNQTSPLHRFLLSHPLLTIILCGLIVSFPLLVWGYPAQSYDGHLHPTWARYFSEQLWSGELYPRWLSGINGSLGSPAFFIYAPLPFYISSLIIPLVPGDPYTLYALGITATLFLIGSGLAAFLWIRQIAPSKGTALIAALFYMIAPYHLAVDFFTRGAFAELASFVWIPFLLYFVHVAERQKIYGLIGITLSYTALLTTHLQTSMICAPLFLLYAFFIGKEGRYRLPLLAGSGLVLGLGLGAIYWVPALAHLKFVHHEFLDLPSLRYNNNWVLPTGKFGTFIFGTLIFMVITAGVSWFLLRQGKRHRSPLVIFSLLVIGAAIFMMMPLSEPIWSAMSLLQRVQFPYRFSIPLLIGTTALLGLVSFGVRSSSRTIRGGFLLFIVGGSILSAAINGYTVYAHDSKFHQTYYQSHMKRLEYGLGAHEYLSRWVSPVAQQADSTLLPLVQKAINAREHIAVVQGKGQVHIDEEGSRSLRVESSSQESLEVTLHRFYYKGWKSPDEPDVVVQPTERTGMMNIVIPPGDRTFMLEMQGIPEEKWGEVISGITAFLLTGLFLFGYIQRQRKAPGGEERIVRKDWNNSPTSDNGVN